MDERAWESARVGMIPSLLPPASRLSRISSWLGGGTHPEESFAAARRDADRRLLRDIADFLEAHDLAPTVDHFRIARSYVLGEDPRLTQAIDRQAEADIDLDIAAIERVLADRPDCALSPERIAAMAEALSARMAEGATTVRQSHASVRDYEHALSAEADAAGHDPDGTIQRLMVLTTAAIARTQELAGRLDETHRETQALRANLEEARRAAEEDHLTGLPNRRCFDNRLHALGPQRAAGVSHCVALCDIDDFKAINDRHGHDTGDRVLKLVARHLTDRLGPSVLVARHGGEEFACLFEDCAADDAMALLDEVREHLAERALVNQASGDGIGRVTFSAGVALLGPDPRVTMRAADAALYLAKGAGKNRIVLAPPPSG